jgi:uncharacterized protein YjiK
MMLIWVALIMIGCEGNSHEIVKIPEASGICFSPHRGTLFVAHDEGIIYEISKEGKILRKKNLGKLNLEGVACDDEKGRLLLAIEGKDNILIVKQKNFKKIGKININRNYKKRIILKKDWKKHGLEGICVVKNSIFLSNQSKKFLPKKDPSIVIRVSKNVKKKGDILELYSHGHKDIAGLTYHDKHLFMVSDTENLLIKYDIEKKKVVGSAPLPKFAQEGVAFDDEENIYITNDKGGVFKYPRKRFGL